MELNEVQRRNQFLWLTSRGATLDFSGRTLACGPQTTKSTAQDDGDKFNVRTKLVLCFNHSDFRHSVHLQSQKGTYFREHTDS